MKKLAIIVFAVLSQAFFGQTMRFVYQATTLPDSTDLKSGKSELTNLDVDHGKSIFYGQNRMKRDSIMQRARQTQTFNFDRAQMENLRSNVNYIVEKDLSSQITTYKDRIGRDQYSYTEKLPIIWKILPETMKIGEYKTQRAEASYGGRTWFAWFTTDLPYQDGPYKFCGLPGLIVKIQDAKKEYAFDLIQVKKITELPTFESRGQTISLSRDKFFAMRKKFQNDPESYMAAQRNSGLGDREHNLAGNMDRNGSSRGGNRGGFGGGMPPDLNQIKEMRQRILQEIKSNNNPIELR